MSFLSFPPNVIGYQRILLVDGCWFLLYISVSSLYFRFIIFLWASSVLQLLLSHFEVVFRKSNIKNNFCTGCFPTILARQFLLKKTNLKKGKKREGKREGNREGDRRDEERRGEEENEREITWERIISRNECTKKFSGYDCIEMYLSNLKR